jgi:hypothetical protein
MVSYIKEEFGEKIILGLMALKLVLIKLWGIN